MGQLLDRSMPMAFEFLVANGLPPEIAALEMYGSCEGAEVFTEMARVGFFKQIRFDSQTSQYGTLSRGRALPFQAEMRAFIERALASIRGGRFAEEWRREQESGHPVFKSLREEAEGQPLHAPRKRCGSC